MKLTKSELKSIVKECLIEILNEGLGALGSPSQQTQTVQKTISSSQLSDSSKPSGPPLQLTPRRPPPSQMREAIKREAGGNKVMESIFADTAASTLQNMIRNESRPQIPSTAGGGVVEHLVAANTPEEIFGDDVTSKWANLAFMDSPTKK